MKIAYKINISKENVYKKNFYKKKFQKKRDIDYETSTRVISLHMRVNCVSGKFRK